MQLHSLGQPCRNFQILGIGKLIDPRDEVEKVVLSNFAAGSTGNLVIVDPETGAGEDIRLPGDSGAWAVLNWRDEKLLVGTCGSYGYLHCLDLVTRQWAEARRDPHETYIWNLCVGSDGLVYGGTYPASCPEKKSSCCGNEGKFNRTFIEHAFSYARHGSIVLFQNAPYCFFVDSNAQYVADQHGNFWAAIG